MATHIIPSSRLSEPAPSRRSLLSFLTATVAGAPIAAAASSLPTKVPPVVQEAPDLIAAGEQLEAAGEVLKAAVARKDDAEALYERTRPAVPDELHARSADRLSNTNLTYTVGDKEVSVYFSRGVRAEIILRDVSRHTKEGKRLRRIARIAKAYEDAEAAAELSAGCAQRKLEAEEAATEVFRVVEALLQQEPTTLRGAGFIARALPIINEAGKTLGYLSATPPEKMLSSMLAVAVARIAQDATPADGGRT